MVFLYKLKPFIVQSNFEINKVTIAEDYDSTKNNNIKMFIPLFTFLIVLINEYDSSQRQDILILWNWFKADGRFGLRPTGDSIIAGFKIKAKTWRTGFDILNWYRSYPNVTFTLSRTFPIQLWQDIHWTTKVTRSKQIHFLHCYASANAHSSVGGAFHQYGFVFQATRLKNLRMTKLVWRTWNVNIMALCQIMKSNERNVVYSTRNGSPLILDANEKNWEIVIL